ncbi:MAG: acyl--CoA ligase [Bacteroidaceae bacterium]|nr:acyl--CoA ligase [Bacteroidaceae bacterium]
MHLEDYLGRWAELHPKKTAVICGEDAITYGRLWKLVRERSLRYKQEGGNAVVVRSTQQADFLITYFACHLTGKAIVPLESDCPDTKLSTIQHEISTCQIPSHVADILYTTGTTGRQKGIMLSHKAIIANAENLISAMQFTEDLLFVISGPLNHIGSLSKVWPTIVSGGTLCITPGMKDMNTFLGAFRLPYHKVATFLVPSSIRMLLQFAQKELASLSEKIDFIETGAAPMPQSDMEALCRLLPQTRLYNTYASTETGIICTHNYNSDYCTAGCLGRPMQHSAVLITADGNVACKGDTLMEGYVGDEALTQSVLHDGTLFTSDQGRIDDYGRLHLAGRLGDIINIGGYKVNPVEVEDAALLFPGIADCICTPSPHPVLGTVLKLYVVPKDGTVLNKKDLYAYLMQKLEHHKVPQLYTVTNHIERTFNGKLNRKYYLT